MFRVGFLPPYREGTAREEGQIGARNGVNLSSKWRSSEPESELEMELQLELLRVSEQLEVRTATLQA